MGCGDYFESVRSLKTRALALWEQVHRRPMPGDAEAVLHSFTGPTQMAPVAAKDPRPMPDGAVPTSHDLVMHLHFPVSGVKVHYDGHTFTYPLAGTARIIDIKAYVQHHYTQVLGYADKNALPDIDVMLIKGLPFLQKAGDQDALERELAMRQERLRLQKKYEETNAMFETEAMILEDVRHAWPDEADDAFIHIADHVDVLNATTTADPDLLDSGGEGVVDAAGEAEGDVDADGAAGRGSASPSKRAAALASEIGRLQSSTTLSSSSRDRDALLQNERQFRSLLQRLKKLKAAVEDNLRSMKREMLETKRQLNAMEELAEAQLLAEAEPEAPGGAKKKPGGAAGSRNKYVDDYDLLDLSKAPQLLSKRGPAISLNFFAPKNHRRMVTVVFDLVPSILIRMPLLGDHESFDSLKLRVLNFLLHPNQVNGNHGREVGAQIVQRLYQDYGVQFDLADLFPEPVMSHLLPGVVFGGRDGEQGQGQRRESSSGSSSTTDVAPSKNIRRRVVGIAPFMLQYVHPPMATKNPSDGTYEPNRNPEWELKHHRAFASEVWPSASVEGTITQLQVEEREVHLLRSDLTR
eukprot:g17152.t1